MIIKYKKNGFFAKRIIPIANAIEQHRVRAFMAVYFVWLIDLCSTAIALGLFSDIIYEANPLANYFFSIGIFGWLIWMVFCAALILFVLYLPDIFLKIDILFKKGMNKVKIKNFKETYNLLRLFNVSIIILVETIVIINNIINLISVI